MPAKKEMQSPSGSGPRHAARAPAHGETAARSLEAENATPEPQRRSRSGSCVETGLRL